jgi:hypothetical protein
MKKFLSKNIYVGLTGRVEADWRAKMEEINRRKLSAVALFLEFYRKSEREKIYQALEKSSVKKIPLIHIRNDMIKDELKYLCDKYNNPCLTIHENSFDKLSEWNGYHQHLFLEMNYNNNIPKNVDISKIGGFCVDLSHFKSAEEKWSKEFEFTLKQRNKRNIFVCNHLNGYDYKNNTDLHTISSLDEFNYLKTLPNFVFGDIIALEVLNPIKEQLKYREHIIKLLNL